MIFWQNIYPFMVKNKTKQRNKQTKKPNPSLSKLRLAEDFLYLIKVLKKKTITGTSSQDGGVGRYTLLPHTTKRRTTPNLKTKNNQNWQKIELYGSPVTKELKKKHSSRLVGGVEMGSQGGEDVQQGNGLGERSSGWWTEGPHIHVQIS